MQVPNTVRQDIAVEYARALGTMLGRMATIRQDVKNLTNAKSESERQYYLRQIQTTVNQPDPSPES